ncbi:hypothetical protein [Pigmentibacter ruber]|uniref:hypothetical protein n=1 Tax=Pigmentibacter ruber TaxID=2683196 RepID=UPI00131E4700|nr:hypothetical protein [Pigmentibacter ruber]
MRSFRYDDLEMQNLNIKEDNINDTIRYTPSNTIRSITIKYNKDATNGSKFIIYENNSIIFSFQVYHNHIENYIYKYIKKFVEFKKKNPNLNFSKIKDGLLKNEFKISIEVLILIDLFILELFSILNMISTCTNTSHAVRKIEQAIMPSSADHDFYKLLKYFIILNYFQIDTIEETVIYGTTFNLKNDNSKLFSLINQIELIVNDDNIYKTFKEYYMNGSMNKTPLKSDLDFQLRMKLDNYREAKENIKSSEFYIEKLKYLKKLILNLMLAYTEFIHSKALIISFSRTYYLKNDYGHDFILTLYQLLGSKYEKSKNWDICIYMTNIQNDTSNIYRLNYIPHASINTILPKALKLWNTYNQIDLIVSLIRTSPINYEKYLSKNVREGIRKINEIISGKDKKDILDYIKNSEEKRNQDSEKFSKMLEGIEKDNSIIKDQQEHQNAKLNNVTDEQKRMGNDLNKLSKNYDQVNKDLNDTKGVVDGARGFLKIVGK